MKYRTNLVFLKTNYLLEDIFQYFFYYRITKHTSILPMNFLMFFISLSKQRRQIYFNDLSWEEKHFFDIFPCFCVEPLGQFHQYFTSCLFTDFLLPKKYNCKLQTVSREKLYITLSYREFHRFGKAKIADGGLVLCSSQFSILPYKMMLDSKVVKIDSKIIISHH